MRPPSWIALLTVVSCGGSAKDSAIGSRARPGIAATPALSASSTPESTGPAATPSPGSLPASTTAPTAGTRSAPEPGSSPVRSTIPLAGGHGADESELEAGDDAFERGDLASAEEHYKAASLAAPRSVAAKVGLARVRIARLDLPLDYGSAKGNAIVAAAAADLARAIAAGPSFGAAFVELGRARLLLADAPGAIEALRKGTRLLDDVPEAHSQLGVALLATGHADEAVRELGRAVELDPQNGARRGNLGTALLMAGRTKEAIAEYEAHVRIDDSDARSHSDLGTALLGTQDLERALSELERAVHLEPTRPAFHSNFGFALQQSGQIDRAISEYREALRLDPNLVSAWINLGIALSRSPRSRAEARAAFDRARSLSPDDPRVKANLEELDAVQGRAPRRAPSP